MLPATIAPRIATATIVQLGRLFDGSAADILSELLEQSRQAGASRIAITTTGAPGDQLMNIVDDGSGIADPASIVTPANFGQPDRARFRKAPAGIGVLSLAGRDVLIRSWSKTERQAGWRTSPRAHGKAAELLPSALTRSPAELQSPSGCRKIGRRTCEERLLGLRGTTRCR